MVSGEEGPYRCVCVGVLLGGKNAHGQERWGLSLHPTGEVGLHFPHMRLSGSQSEQLVTSCG